MIDIHCHILPGIDDGPSQLSESVRMAEIAAADGIHTIVATPHLNDTVHPAGLIREKVDRLNNALQKNNISITILSGADVASHMPLSILPQFTLNKTAYILIEFPYSHLPRTAKDTIFKVLVSGLKPIITHPERNPSIIADPNLLFQLLDSNVHVQITADSLTGAFGRDAEDCAVYLLKKGAVDIIASDAHSADYRKPILSKGLRIAEKIVGREKAHMLVCDNPAAVIAGARIAAL